MPLITLSTPSTSAPALAPAFALALTLCSSLSWAMSDTPDPEPTPTPSPQGQVSFIAIGDMGTGSSSQYRVARAMEALCQQQRCEFALGLGDNIYELGINSVNDDQMNTKFEFPYEDLDFRFYMALGNHDNTGSGHIVGGNNDAGEFQVDYHYKSDRLSEKWQMPARYYNFFSNGNQQLQYQQPSKAFAQFVAVDSNPIAGVDLDISEYGIGYKNQQKDWLQQKLKRNAQQWNIAFAHHPYLSNGRHGNAGLYDFVPGNGLIYRSFLKDTVCDKADLFITGHDHDLQWLKAQSSCGKTEFIVSGAGAKTRGPGNRNLNDEHFQIYDTLGFFWIDLNGSKATIEAYKALPQAPYYQRLYRGQFNKK